MTTISVVSAPVPTLSISGNTLLCKPAINSTNLTASGASSYAWNNGFTSANVYLTPTITTVYSVTGTQSPCSSTKTISVLVSSAPTPTITSSSPSVCVGQTATITVVGGVSYLWNNNSTSNSVVITPTVTGNPVLMVTATNSVGCSFTSAFTQTVVNCSIGLNELEWNEASIFPNPMSNSLTINLSEGLVNKANIELYDAVGRLVIKESLANAHNTINVSNLQDGIYIYKISSSGSSLKVGKLVKN